MNGHWNSSSGRRINTPKGTSMTEYKHPLDKWIEENLIETTTGLKELQLRWTKKTMDTRRKLGSLRHKINVARRLSKFDELGDKYYIVDSLVKKVQVDEVSGQAYPHIPDGISMTMLSPKGVEWCNAVLDELKDLEKTQREEGNLLDTWLNLDTTWLNEYMEQFDKENP